MKNINLCFMDFIFAATITSFTFMSTVGGTVHNKAYSGTIHSSTDSNNHNNTENTTKCVPVEYGMENVTFQKNNSIFLKTKNITLNSTKYKIKDDKVFLCLPSGLLSVGNKLNCKYKFEYKKNEYYILPNKSAVVGKALVPEDEYELSGTLLLICAPEEDDPVSSHLTIQDVSIYVGQVGSIISIIALMAHLTTFLFLSTLRNLPGYNLASLSVAFLLAYSFSLIGQIREVLGVFCVISAILQQNFFLVAFFCMNVLAFDVWRTLKLATEKLVVGSQNVRRRQFIWYSLYAWGIPPIITSISVIFDNVDGIPSNIKPDYGKDDYCWMGNKLAKAVFFAVPAFTLFLINGIFFIISAWIIFSNTMKISNDQSKHAVKLNYILYVRLALMMGLTWLVSLIALISKSGVLWLIFDLLNSLQGLFLFLLFTCTKKVFKQFVKKTSSMKQSGVRQSTLASNSSSLPIKHSLAP